MSDGVRNEYRAIRIGEAGHLMLSIRANIYEMTENDRAFVFGLIDKMKRRSDSVRLQVAAASRGG